MGTMSVALARIVAWSIERIAAGTVIVIPAVVGQAIKIHVTVPCAVNTII